jgi:hypothetical protein
MRVVRQLGLCCLLAGGLWAQRGGGGHGGGGMGGAARGGGGFRGGGGAGMSHGGFSGGGFRGGYSGGYVGGNHGYGGYGGYRGYGGFYGRSAAWGFGLGLGIGYGYGVWGYSYPYYSYPYVGGYWPGYSDVYPYDYYASSYASPPVTVVYAPQPQAAPVVIEQRASPVTREYDQFGQELRPAPQAATGSSPIYLIAFRDNTIRAALSYSVEGQTLHYVTLQHEQKQAPLESVDRGLTSQLNRERRVPFQLP